MRGLLYLIAVVVSVLSASSVRAEGFSVYSVTLSPDARGHYITPIRINGRQMEALVDTGASAVALMYEDAYKLNLVSSSDKFDIPVNTGNGVVYYRQVKIDRVDLGGGVSVQNVVALVAPKGVLKANLLGMTFLSKLRRFEVRDGKLILND